jgi:hypothetical protein
MRCEHQVIGYRSASAVIASVRRSRLFGLRGVSLSTCALSSRSDRVLQARLEGTKPSGIDFSSTSGWHGVKRVAGATMETSQSCGVVSVSASRVCGVPRSIPAGAIAVLGGVWVAYRLAIGRFAAWIDMVGLSPSMIGAGDVWRCAPSCFSWVGGVVRGGRIHSRQRAALIGMGRG